MHRVTHDKAGFQDIAIPVFISYIDSPNPVNKIGLGRIAGIAHVQQGRGQAYVRIIKSVTATGQRAATGRNRVGSSVGVDISGRWVWQSVCRAA